MRDLDFNADRLYGFYAALRPARQKQLLRVAMRRSALELKRAAESELMGCVRDPRSPAALKKGIWIDVYSRTAGFRVSVAGKRGLVPSRTKGGADTRRMPVLLWLEDGTVPRRMTRATGARRGGISPRLFLYNANEKAGDRIRRELEGRFLDNVAKEARKYGCEV